MVPSAITTDTDRASGLFGERAANRHRMYLGNGNSNVSCSNPRRLLPFPEDIVHDLVCVGFGPASLAIAIALHDSLDRQQAHGSLRTEPRVRFLERQKDFGWHAGMLLPGAKMQISFIKDLATLRDPCSYFTFLNYLKQHNRLVQFSNLGTFLPSRLEFADYLGWAASHFDDVVDYGHQVQRIRPWKRNGGEKFDCLQVESHNTITGERTLRFSRNVAIAVGGRPALPPAFPKSHQRVIHSSQYDIKITAVLPSKDEPYDIAVVGSGQSAAEVFHDLHSRYPHAKTTLVLRDSALRPSDDSPFVNEVFNPDAVDSFFEHPQEFREKELQKNKSTNYSVVRLNLLERIYESQYEQSIKQPDSTFWQHRILALKEVVEVTDVLKGNKLNLTLRSLDPLCEHSNEDLVVDAVILATGYVRDVHHTMLQECEIINDSSDGNWQVGRDYKVELNPGLVEEDVGIWLQGCNEGTHGLSDTLLSVVATRSGELVQSIFGQRDEWEPY